MHWIATLADGDAVIVREDAPGGPHFVVHNRRGPQFTCRNALEAEARALACVLYRQGRAWYADSRGLQPLGSQLSRSFERRRASVRPSPNHLATSDLPKPSP